jgi:predicted nuclease with TOPRIM domain
MQTQQDQSSGSALSSIQAYKAEFEAFKEKSLKEYQDLSLKFNEKSKQIKELETEKMQLDFKLKGNPCI